jgi:hypothetical protein
MACYRRRCRATLPSAPRPTQTVRNVFVIGPDKKIKLILVYPMTTGRNFDEVLRVIDSLQLTAKHKVATPVNWKNGEDVIIAGSVTDEDARKQYPQGWKAPRPYLRIVPQPSFRRVEAGRSPCRPHGSAPCGSADLRHLRHGVSAYGDGVSAYGDGLSAYVMTSKSCELPGP